MSSDVARMYRVGKAGLRADYVENAIFVLGGVGVWNIKFIGMQSNVLPFLLIFDYD